jgi:Transposase and inactivated derivatives
MRGKAQAQPDFLTVVNLNAAVPADHPLRAIKRRVDSILQKLSPLFDKLYSEEGRPSIPPEQLLKARILTALYSVRSEQLFCEQLGYNLLWLWFLDRELSEGSFDRSVFAKNYQRVLSAEVAQLFFAEVYDLSRQEGWTSDEHFTADGTLIESWASLKSFVRKDGADKKKVQSAKDDDPGNPTINFHGEKRRNDTHQSTTDGQSVLYRKAKGKEAKLCFGAHALMENRNGLCAEFTIHNPITESESMMALRQMDEHRQFHEGTRPMTLGADKGYHQKQFVEGCRQRRISPHVACKEKVKVDGLDGRTTAKAGYQVSLRIRKRVEEIFGWLKTVGGLRRSRYRGQERTQAWAHFVAGTYNLLRLARLEALKAT